MKRTSVKRGVEGAIAFGQSHGEEVDWVKVGSSHACPLSEMEEFFKKAKQYAFKIVSLTCPSAASSTSVPESSTPPSSNPVADALMSTNTSILVDSVGPPSAEVCRTVASFP
jgi:hypothetical protein